MSSTALTRLDTRLRAIREALGLTYVSTDVERRVRIMLDAASVMLSYSPFHYTSQDVHRLAEITDGLGEVVERGMPTRVSHPGAVDRAGGEGADLGSAHRISPVVSSAAVLPADVSVGTVGATTDDALGTPAPGASSVDSDAGDVADARLVVSVHAQQIRAAQAWGRLAERIRDLPLAAAPEHVSVLDELLERVPATLLPDVLQDRFDEARAAIEVMAALADAAQAAALRCARDTEQLVDGLEDPS